MNTNLLSTRTYNAIIEQGRLWFRYARLLESTLPDQGSRLWVKPTLHAQYGLRQSTLLGARTFILTSRLDDGDEETLQTLLHQEQRGYGMLRTRQAEGGRLILFAQGGRRLGRLNRAAWSWIGPLVEMGYEPAFFLRDITVHEGALKAHVIISHFHQGVEAYLFEHYRSRVEAVLS